MSATGRWREGTGSRESRARPRTSSGATRRPSASEITSVSPEREPIRQSLQPDLWVRPDFRPEEGELERDEILERGLEVVLEEEEVEERKAA